MVKSFSDYELGLKCVEKCEYHKNTCLYECSPTNSLCDYDCVKDFYECLDIWNVDFFRLPILYTSLKINQKVPASVNA